MKAFATKAVSWVTPWWVLDGYFKHATRGYSIALCLHRVANGKRRETDLQPNLTIEASKLDALLAVINRAYQPVSGEKLFVTFDDGYQDAVDYTASRASRYPAADWILFVCPQKAENQVGFRWDAYEYSHRMGHLSESLWSFIGTKDNVDPAVENSREDLREVAKVPDFRLSTVKECLSVSEQPNVYLGNHTNIHIGLGRIGLPMAKQEIEDSFLDFNRVFFKPDHFAFPHGFPGIEFNDAHVDYINRVSQVFMWSVDSRPFRFQDAKPGDVLPRFGINGTKSVKAIYAGLCANLFLDRIRCWFKTILRV